MLLRTEPCFHKSEKTLPYLQALLKDCKIPNEEIETMTFQNCKLIGDGIDPDAYHRQEKGVHRGHPEFVMSRSELMLFTSNPARWLAGYKPKDSDATDWGTLIDTMLLDPARFEEKIAVKPATYTNEKTGKETKWTRAANYCKEWEAEHEGMMLVAAQKFGDAKAAVAKLFEDDELSRLIHRAKKQVFVVGEWHDKETGLVIPAKTLIDLVPPADSEFGKSILDFKTARQAAPRPWGKAVFDRHYDAQAAMILDMYVAATKEDRQDFRHIVQENVLPWQVETYVLTLERTDVGRMKVNSALKLYARCLKQNDWPSWNGLTPVSHKLDGRWIMIQPDEWMIRAVLEAMFTEPEPEEPATESEDVPT